MKSCLLFILILCSATTFSQPSWNWARSSGRYTSHDHCYGLATDANGFSYATGEFQDTIVFGSTTLINTTGANSIMFITKYDSNGNIIWAKIPGANNGCVGNDAAVDASGNFYITGSYRMSLTLGSITLTGSSLLQNVFVAKFDSAGNVLWAKDGSSYWSDAGNSLCVDKDGNVYVTGVHEDSSITFGNLTMPCNGRNDVFLVKYDMNGVEQWVINVGGPMDEVAGGVTTDKNGNVYITGAFRNGVTIGTHNLVGSNNGAAGVFVAKYDPQGAVLWATGSGGFPSNGFGTDLATDAYENCYVTGYFSSGEIYFQNDTLTNSGVDDIFLLKYDNTGLLKWSRSAGGNDYDRGRKICVDDDGNSYLTGYIKSNFVSFGSFNLYAVHLETFVINYDSSGTPQWGLQTHGNENESPFDISRNGNDIYIGGDFSSPLCVIGNDSLLNSDQFLGSYDLYVAKISGIITNVDETNHANSITVYPNPVSDQFTMRIDDDLKISSANLYDLQGNKIGISKIESDEIHFDLKNLAAGMYFLQLTVDDKYIYTKRIIIQ